ncbi:hypothetical protein SPF06_09620 [Sinomonas sp. JGH33]|uniref:Uncharacterized protein n=1 Tax=Sinomonas terricola TaxID=3110330 RepID=A0ABU5T653_9MICC|nr:hypothetical protein [Sinomonas sp. JGH33]MEA5454976.1 hypothetical protein [Sinomonas sp. JGH33]
MKRPIFIGLITALIVIHAAIIGAAIYAIAYVTFHDSRQDLPLSNFVPNPSNPGASDYAFEGLRDATGTLCGPGKINCSEAYRGERLTLLRFDSKNKAQNYAVSLGEDGHQSDWIVADFSRAPLSDFDRLMVRQSLDGTWSTSPD